MIRLIKRAFHIYKKKGLSELVKSIFSFIFLHEFLYEFTTWVVAQTGIGKDWFKEDWDLLIILDTCRVDTLRTVEDNYTFINNINTTLSKGGQSAEWMMNNFTKKWSDKIAKTALITSNPHSKTVFENRLEDTFDGKPNRGIDRLKKFGTSEFVSNEDFGHYRTFWQLSGEFGERPPRPVTDHAIELSRESDFDRIVLHYMPPHAPHVGGAKLAGRDSLKEHEKNPFEHVITTGDSNPIHETHARTLEWVLEDVELLLNNVDAERVIITSDHGDAFGEYGMYRHKVGHLSPQVRVVPWIETSAADSHTYEPDSDSEEFIEQSQKESLEALGYIN